jgi:hypothetical protein
MSNKKLDPNTRNNDIGLQFGKSRRVVVDALFGELASWVKAVGAGDIIWSNSVSGEVGIWNLEAGESFPVVCDQILSAATIDGNAETTTATTMLWASTPSDLG